MGTNLKEQYLVTIEFRYSDEPKNELYSTSKNKIVTIGVYNSFEEACEGGNKVLENLENKFGLHTFPDGRQANKERFSLNGGAFGSKKTLITELAYLKTPFSFFAKITTLKYEDINESVQEVNEAVKRYRKYKLESV